MSTTPALWCKMVYGDRSKKGITLLENILALLITVLLISGLTQLFLLGPTQTKIANHRVSSLNLAQAKIEQLISLGYNGVVTASYNPAQQEAVTIDTADPNNALDDLSGIRETAVTGITNGKKIVVIVSWAEFNQQFSETAEKVIYKFD